MLRHSLLFALEIVIQSPICLGQETAKFWFLSQKLPPKYLSSTLGRGFMHIISFNIKHQAEKLRNQAIFQFFFVCVLFFGGCVYGSQDLA